MWIVGGFSSLKGPLHSTEFVSIDKESLHGPSLPFSLYMHCMVKFNDQAIYIISGYQNSQHHLLSKSTWIANPSKEFQLKPGPSLNFLWQQQPGGSLGITCTTYKDNLGVTKIIVGYGRLEYVETLYPSLETNKWIAGKNK